MINRTELDLLVGAAGKERIAFPHRTLTREKVITLSLRKLCIYVALNLEGNAVELFVTNIHFVGVDN